MSREHAGGSRGIDAYNQMDLLLGKGPSARHPIFYFGGPQIGAIRIDDMKFWCYEQFEGDMK
jgi:arylsulfatase